MFYNSNRTKMNTTSKIILRSDFTKKDGQKSIYLRLTINRKVKYFTLNISCQEKYWNKNKCRVSISAPNSYRINLLLDKFDSKAKQIIFDFAKQDLLLNFLDFSQHFRNDHYNNNSFISFVQNQSKKYKDKFKPGTIKNYSDQLNKLQSFRSDIRFSDLNLNFMSEYEQYLITIRGNGKNTVIKSLIFIKNMLNKAVESGIIKENPCKGYKLGRIEGNREHLSLKELKTLNRLLLDQKLKPNKANVLRYFLFCCYTGLRYGDIQTLKYSNIKDGIISIKMHKTGELVKIPLIRQAKALIQNETKYFANQTVFKVLTGQPTNRYLKEIMKVAEIKMHISFHCARHTFATNCIKLGIPIDVLSKLLGHTDIKTTLLYIKYSTDIKEKEMEKWNH